MDDISLVKQRKGRQYDKIEGGEDIVLRGKCKWQSEHRRQITEKGKR